MQKQLAIAMFVELRANLTTGSLGSSDVVGTEQPNLLYCVSFFSLSKCLIRASSLGAAI